MFRTRYNFSRYLQGQFRGWGYEDFTAGAITTTSVTLTDNENGTDLYGFETARIINGSGVIVRKDYPSKKPYTGTTVLFSTKVEVSTHTGNTAVTLTGVPHSSWGDIRIYYLYDYPLGVPQDYQIPSKAVSSNLFAELQDLFLTEEELSATSPITYSSQTIGLDYDTGDFALSGTSLIIQDSGIDHTGIQNIGSNTHAQIDTHLALSNEHIDWTSTTENLLTTGTIAGTSFTDGAATLTGGALSGLANFTVDNVNINGGTINCTKGDLTITAAGGDISFGNETLTTTGLSRLDGGVGIGTDPTDGFGYLYLSKSDATVTGITINNSGAGDAALLFRLGGVAKWTVGVDNDDSDKFKIGQGALGANDAFEIDASGNFAFNSGNFTGVGTIGCGAVTGGAYNGVTLSASAGEMLVDDATNSHSITTTTDFVLDGNQAAGFYIAGGTTLKGLTVTDTSQINQDVRTTATPSFASGVTIGNLTLADGSITDSGGAIDFVNENLTTTGTGKFNNIGIATAPNASYGIHILDTFTATGCKGIYVQPFVNTTSGAIADARAMDFLILTNAGGNDITALYGMAGMVGVGGTFSGTVTTAYGVFADGIFTAGTTTDFHGVHIDDPVTGANKLTNNYGLYIKDQTGGATLNWAIYSAGADSYHAGDIILEDPTNKDVSVGSDAAGYLDLKAPTGIRGNANVDITGTINTTSDDNWDLNDYVAGVVVDTGYVVVTINGTDYKLLARLEP